MLAADSIQMLFDDGEPFSVSIIGSGWILGRQGVISRSVDLKHGVVLPLLHILNI